jgi:ABC-type uncharacterized transport system auxiliary subunit
MPAGRSKQRLAVALSLAALLAGCGGAGSGAKGNQTRFLLLAHQPLAGSLNSWPDARLLDLGQQACVAMDSNTSSDQIVAQLGNDPLPGSADYNAYSFIVVDAASELCPVHKAQFSGAGLPGL